MKKYLYSLYFVLCILTVLVSLVNAGERRFVRMTENGTMFLMEGNNIIEVLPISDPRNLNFEIHDHKYYVLRRSDNRYIIAVYDDKKFTLRGLYYWSGRGPWCCQPVD